jgi:hypothetical protein
MSSGESALAPIVAVGPVRFSPSSFHGTTRLASPKQPVFPVLHIPYDLYKRFR